MTETPSGNLVKRGLGDELEDGEGQPLPTPPNPDEAKIKELTDYCKEVGRFPDNWAKLKAPEKRIAFKCLFMPEEAATDTFDPTDLVHALANRVENMEPDEMKKQLKELSRDVGENYFVIGGILANITAKSLFKEFGYETFQEWVEAETDFEIRKARYLIANYTKLIELGIPWAKFDGIGWSKISALLPVITVENADEWIERARTMSQRDLKEAVKAARGTDDGKGTTSTPSDLKTMSFKLHPDQAETVDNAIQLQMERLPTDAKGRALEIICAEWVDAVYQGTGQSSEQKPSLRTKKACLKAVEGAVERLKELTGGDYGALEPLVPLLEEKLFPAATFDVSVEDQSDAGGA